MGARRLSWICTRARGSCCLPSPACGAGVGRVGWLSRVGPAWLLSFIPRGWCPGRCLPASPEPCPSFEAVAARPCPSDPFFLPALCSSITARVPALSWSTSPVRLGQPQHPCLLGWARYQGLGNVRAAASVVWSRWKRLSPLPSHGSICLRGWLKTKRPWS